MAQSLEVAAKKQADSAFIDQAMELGKKYHQQGQIDLALQSYDAVLQKQADHADALHFSGVAAYQQKRTELAETLFVRAIAANPRVALYYCNLGLLFRDQAKLVLAAEQFQKAIALQPDYADAYFKLGATQTDLGQFADGATSSKKAIELQPAHADAWNNLGTALRLQDDFQGAMTGYRRAIALKPDYAAAHSNLAATYLAIKDLDQAAVHCLKALELDANNADAYLYLGTVMQELGQLEQSEQFYVKAAELAPENITTLWNLGLVLLARGKLEAGWNGYEYRWSKELQPIIMKSFPYPWWMGESLADKTILVWCEQGIGDEIMLANMYPDLIARAKLCIFACSKKLVPLFKSSFPGALVINIAEASRLSDVAQQIDVQSAAGSLARWLRPTVASFPRAAHFLIPDSARVGYWKNRLRELGPELKVGICWRSGNMTGSRAYYCSQIEDWVPVFNVPGIRFVNLQYDECSNELARAKQLCGVDVQVFPEVNLYDDLAETAALTKALDLVISSHTAAAIIAAAAGVPTWILTSGFHWQKLGTSENCWYSSLRTFHKQWDQAWKAELDEVALELQAKTNLLNASQAE